MECAGEVAGRLESISAALCTLNPGWRPLSGKAKAAISASVATSPDPTDAQRAMLARLLRGASTARM